MPPRQTIEDCTADRGGGVKVEGGLELIDCRILRCHAATSGGGLNLGTSDRMNLPAKMTRGTIIGCSALKGGGSYSYTTSSFTLVDVLVAECVATVEAENGGGGIVLNSDQASLTMSGGWIRDCATPKGRAGGLLVEDGAG